jgi:hypothetical protein
MADNLSAVKSVNLFFALLLYELLLTILIIITTLCVVLIKMKYTYPMIYLYIYLINNSILMILNINGHYYPLNYRRVADGSAFNTYMY